MRTLRTLGTIACLAVAGMAMSGCVRMTSNLQVDAVNETVTGTVHLESDEASLEFIINHDKSPKLKPWFPDAHTHSAAFEALLGQIPWLPPFPQVQQKTVQGGSIYYADVSYNAKPFAEFNPDDGMSFQRDGDTIRFRLSLDDAIYGRGIDTEGLGVKHATIQIAITMPGKVSSPDGKVSGSTVTWKIAGCPLGINLNQSQKPCPPHPKELTAVSVLAPSPSPSPPPPSQSPAPSQSSPDEGGGLPMPLLLAGAVVVAAAIFTLVLVLIWRGRGSKNKEDAPAGPPTEY